MRRALSLAASSLVLGGLARAGAEQPAHGDAARRAEAKAIAVRGDAEFYAGRCDRAIPLWQRAEAAYHAPTLLVRIARCQAQLGRVVDASSTLALVVAEPLRERSPPAFYVAQEQAKRELLAVRTRIATLHIVARTGGDRAPLVVEIDGVPQRAGAWTFPVDPGEHRVRVRAGTSSWQTTVRLRDGERLSCDVALWAEPEPRRPRAQRGIGLAALGVGGAAVATGIGFSVAALAASRRLDALCGDGRAHCPPRAQGDIDRARDYATVADGAVGGGAALVILGALALATAPRPGDAWHVRIAATAKSASLRVDF